MAQTSITKTKRLCLSFSKGLCSIVLNKCCPVTADHSDTQVTQKRNNAKARGATAVLSG